jgi:hypothetical protein
LPLVYKKGKGRVFFRLAPFKDRSGVESGGFPVCIAVFRVHDVDYTLAVGEGSPSFATPLRPFDCDSAKKMEIAFHGFISETGKVAFGR